MDQLLEEILEQPQALRDTVADLVGSQADKLAQVRALAQQEPRPFDTIIMTGMGSSYYALPIAAIVLQQSGIPCVVLEASELLHYQVNVLGPRVLLLVVSQSGESIEIVRLIEAINERGPELRPTIISLSSNLENTLARNANITLRMQAGRERSIAIKTHTCTQATLTLVATALLGGDLNQAANELNATADTLGAMLEQREILLTPLFELFTGTTTPFLLGRGWSQVSAIAGALALKEGGHVAAEGMNCGAFRHGTLEIAGPGLDVLIFVSDPKTAAINIGLAQDLAEIGTRVAVVGTHASSEGDTAYLSVKLPHVEPALAPLLEVPVSQLWCRHLSIVQGRSPGILERLPKVIRSE